MEFDIVIRFFKLIGHKLLDLSKVYVLLFSCSFCFPNNGRSHQSKAAFFTPLNFLRWRRYFCSWTNFLKNTWIFAVFYLFSCGWTGCELYVWANNNEPPCYKNCPLVLHDHVGAFILMHFMCLRSYEFFLSFSLRVFNICLFLSVSIFEGFTPQVFVYSHFPGSIKTIVSLYLDETWKIK